MTRAERIYQAACQSAERLTGDKSGNFYWASVAGCLNGHVQDLCDELSKFRNPVKNVYEYHFYGGTLVCEYYFQPAEKQTYLEPGCDAYAELTAVWANGMDVFSLLPEKLIEEIEERIVSDEVEA